MEHNQDPQDVLWRAVRKLSELLGEIMPSIVVVQGDTTTALAASLASYYMHVPVAHVEAGLRTYDHESPFPEEGNRQLIDRLARWCFVPTETSRDNLLGERIPSDRIFVTGNTVIDALLWAQTRSGYECPPNTLLVTLHRRESFGQPLLDIVRGVCDFLDEHDDARVLWPVHPNPNVRSILPSLNRRVERVNVVEPLNYIDFAGALRTCRCVLTDSGGVQEEAPSLGKIVLVAREKTERPEGVALARNRLVGRERGTVAAGLEAAWREQPYQGELPAPNPFGDGRSAERIATVLAEAVSQAEPNGRTA
jgi:UDP-N-acetylglucosamine 2-epimerase (non-hydrolysing)